MPTNGTILRTIGALVVAGFVVLASVICKHSFTYEYYRQIVFADDHTFHPVGRLDTEAISATHSAYYRLARDTQGRLTDIEYFVQNKPAKDHVMGTARIAIQYLDGLQIVSFRDADRTSAMSYDGVYSMALKYFGGRLASVVNFDKNGAVIKCKHGLAAISWKYDESGKRTTQKNFSSDLQPTEDTGGVATIRWTYSPQRNTEMPDYIDGENLHFEESGPSLLIYRRLVTTKSSSDSDTVLREEYDKEGRRIQRASLDPAGSLRSDINSVALVRWKHDVAGNVVEQSHYGLERRLTNDQSGISIIRWKYDRNHQKIERDFFNAERLQIEDAHAGIAVTRWVYHDGRRLEESYFDLRGRRKEDLICGIATTRWKYWREEDPDSRWSQYKDCGEESYYDANEERKERKDVGIASVRWIDKSFQERWYDDKYTRIKEWSFHGKDGKLKAITKKPYYNLPLAIEQWVYSLHGGLSRRYFLGENGAKLIED